MWGKLLKAWAVIADTVANFTFDWKSLAVGFVAWSASWWVGVVTEVSAFWLAVGVPVAGLAAIVAYSVWLRRDRKSPEPAKARPTPAPVKSIYRGEGPEPNYREDTVFMEKLVADHGANITDKTFFDCTIIGPANVYFVDNCRTLDTRGPVVDAVWVSKDPPVISNVVELNRLRGGGVSLAVR